MVCSDPLIDEKATRSEILRKLNWLKRQATQHDLALVALAGHGQKDADENFFFIPYDYESGDNEEGLAYSGVAWDDLLRPLANMPCPVVLVMDACHSGTITLRITAAQFAKSTSGMS